MSLSPHGGQISPALLPLWTKIEAITELCRRHVFKMLCVRVCSPLQASSFDLILVLSKAAETPEMHVNCEPGHLILFDLLATSYVVLHQPNGTPYSPLPH
jgi:hypothetical protein